jgi:poly-gamma-glutamate synthesis protein (capsule biosynthesis protein)
MLGDSAICVGFGLASRYGPKRFAELFAQLRGELAGLDVVVGNLETVLSPTVTTYRRWADRQMRGYLSFAPALRQVGFTVLNVANNHAMQHGPEAFRETVGALGAADIAVCGLRGTAPWSSAPVVVRTAAGGQSVGVLGYCLRPRQFDAGEPPYAEGTPAGIVSDVGRLRDLVDVVVVSLHWGEEFVTQPSVDETHLGRAVVDAGATLVVGHHPHVVRPVESYAGGVIAYSLGNLVSDQVWHPETRSGLVLRCAIQDRRLTSLDLHRTWSTDRYVPELAQEPVIVVESPAALEAGAYARAARRALTGQRAARYRHALRHLHQYPGTILAQLLGVTLRNKVLAVVRRLAVTPWRGEE